MNEDADELVTPVWAESFRVGETFALRGWTVRIAGHFVHEGHPAGFALTIEGPTMALQKKILAAAKRRTRLTVARSRPKA